MSGTRLLQAIVERLLHIFGSMLRVPQLGCDCASGIVSGGLWLQMESRARTEEVLSLLARCLQASSDSFTYLLLVAINSSQVQMGFTRAQGDRG